MKQALTAAILVGGKGTRLQPLISDVPKSLANIAGEPFLFLILRELAAVGIKKIILLTGYLHEQIQAACGDGSQFGIEILYSREHEPLGTAGALGHARALLQNVSEFILLNGDTYISSSIRNLIKFSLDSKVIGVLGVMQPDETKRYGSVEVDAKTGIIQAFREKDENNTGLVSAGIYKFSSSIFDVIPQGASSLEQDIFPALIAKGYLLQSIFLEGTLNDIGLPESYMAFHLERLIHTANLTLSMRELFAGELAGIDREIN